MFCFSLWLFHWLDNLVSQFWKWLLLIFIFAHFFWFWSFLLFCNKHINVRKRKCKLTKNLTVKFQRWHQQSIFSQNTLSHFLWLFIILKYMDRKKTTIIYCDGYSCSPPMWIHLKFWHLRKNVSIRFLAQSCVWYQDWRDGIRIQRYIITEVGKIKFILFACMFRMENNWFPKEGRMCWEAAGIV